MVYYFCHCTSLHVCPGQFLFWIAVWSILGKETVLSFRLSACSVMLVVPLL